MEEPLLMDGKMFLVNIVLPFLLGWSLAWSAAMCLIRALLGSGRKTAVMTFFAVLFGFLGAFCFTWINILAIARLHDLGFIQEKEVYRLDINLLPALLCFGFFVRRSYKKIAGL